MLNNFRFCITLLNASRFMNNDISFNLQYIVDTVPTTLHSSFDKIICNIEHLKIGPYKICNFVKINFESNQIDKDLKCWKYKLQCWDNILNEWSLLMNDDWRPNSWMKLVMTFDWVLTFLLKTCRIFFLINLTNYYLCWFFTPPPFPATKILFSYWRSMQFWRESHHSSHSRRQAR